MRIAALAALAMLAACRRTDPRGIVADRADGATAPVVVSSVSLAPPASSTVVTEAPPSPPTPPREDRPPPPPKAAQILLPPAPPSYDDPPPIFGTTEPGTTKTVAGGVGTAVSGTSGPVVAAPTSGTRAKPPAGLCSKTPFPTEATADTALVTALVKVDAKGDVSTVTIVSDPGQGFGREARACLLAAHFTPATDGSGAPVPDSVTLSVRFTR